MEFNTDDDMEEQPKNANDVKVEGKVRVRKKTVHYYEFSSEDEEGECWIMSARMSSRTPPVCD